jgi:hypothetical protein
LAWNAAGKAKPAARCDDAEARQIPASAHWWLIVFELIDQAARRVPIGRESRGNVPHRADKTMSLLPRKMTGSGSL